MHRPEESTPLCNESEGSAAKTPRLSLLPVVVLIFYEVSGGPFGIEDAVSSGGPLLAVLGFIVLPLVWSVPEALMAAELSTAFPDDSGFVGWVSEAFGHFWGFQVGWWSWLSGVADNALYPVLFLDYLQGWSHSQLTGEWRAFAVLSISISLTFLNWRGLNLVGKLALVLCVFSLAPFVVMILIGLPQAVPSRLLTTVPWAEVKWGRYLNVMFWNLNYWDSVSTLAAEVESPRTTLPRALGIAVVLVVFTYLTPLLVAISTDSNISTDIAIWRDGHFAQVATDLGGSWLGGWVVAAAGVSNIGLFEAEMSSDSYQLLGMAEQGLLPAAFARRSKHGTPTLGIAFSAVGVCFASVLDFSEIVEMLNFLYAFAALFEFAAIIQLRISKPELPRPFRIPTGTVGLCVMLLPATLLLLCVVALATWRTWFVFVCATSVGLILPQLVKHAKENAWCDFIDPNACSATDSLVEELQVTPESLKEHAKKWQETNYEAAALTL